LAPKFTEATKCRLAVWLGTAAALIQFTQPENGIYGWRGHGFLQRPPSS